MIEAKSQYGADDVGEEFERVCGPFVRLSTFSPLEVDGKRLTKYEQSPHHLIGSIPVCQLQDDSRKHSSFAKTEEETSSIEAAFVRRGRMASQRDTPGNLTEVLEGVGM
jgi:hypothetical protein